MVNVDLETKLLAAFRYFDFNNDGTIDRDDLTEICKRLDPETWTDAKVDTLMKELDKDGQGAINYHDFTSWIVSSDDDGKRVFTIYEVALAKMPGEKLADGDQTDAGVDKIKGYLNNVMDLQPHEYSLPKTTSRLTWLQEIADLLDPSRNPGGFRMCQAVTIEKDATGTLLGLSRHCKNDTVVNKSLEILARTAFGNEETAGKVAMHPELVPTIQTLIATAKQPVKLTTLQLVQAIVATISESDAVGSVPSLLLRVVFPLLEEKAFPTLALGTFDVIVSASFSVPSTIIELVSWDELTKWLAEHEDAARPTWLDQHNLTVLACGLLASNVLSRSTGEVDLDARNKMLELLGSGSFLDFFAVAFGAAVERREWPAHSGAFHSVKRLASVALSLSKLGFRHRLLNVVEPLAKAAEISQDDSTIRIVLQALRSLADDFACLEKMLALSAFRTDTLVLYEQADEEEASELTSYLNLVENAIHSAECALQESNQHLRNPPSVKQLAEIFNRCSSMEGELSFEQVVLALKEVPVGPNNDVVTSLFNKKSSTFSFGSFARHIYGTPTLLGWWPSLMEEANELWTESNLQDLKPPSLAELLPLFELGAKGTSSLSSEVILNVVLPAGSFPVEGEFIEDAFAEIRGESLNFTEFVRWMSTYFKALDKQRRETEQVGEECELRQRQTMEQSS